jgi:nitrogen-specific signal transduction histidine kinase
MGEKPVAKRKNKRVLLCDDNVEFSKSIAEFLKLQGYDASIAITGREALAKAAKHLPDLVLLDYRLPDMDGIVVLQEMRSIEHTLPIIVMTGYGHEKLGAEVIKLGAMDYLLKPFKNEELMESISNTMWKVDEIQKKQELDKFVFWGKLFPLVAHEIRNPLHAIGGALALMKDRQRNDKTTIRALQIIQEEIMRLDEFINQCLDFSRPPSKDGFSFVNLNDVVSSSVQLMAPLLRGAAKKIRFETAFDTSLPAVYISSYEIKQVLINLLKNAVEAIPKGGSVAVETSTRKDESGQSAEIRITDTGMGIKKKDLVNVFNPFFTIKKGGMGLGLAVCKKIIEENHHGQIRIDSELTKGTTVTVTLPIRVVKDGSMKAS